MENNDKDKKRGKFHEKLTDVTGKIGKTASNIGDKAKDLAGKSQKAVISTLDVNADGKVDIEDIIILALRTPGVKIDRSQFLKKELSRKHSDDVVDKAIVSNPKQADISLDEINTIADEIIEYERRCVTGISAALGMPGGAAMAATIPADIVQYYGYTLRAAQKLMYLYGFPEIQMDENALNLDTETINTLTIALGVMFGVANANNALKSMAKMLAVGVEKQLMKKALTKGTIYPIVKSISKWFGVKMTKSVFSSAVGKSIPVVGGVIGGGLTYLMFKPSCDKLKETLRNTMLSDPNYVATPEDDIIDIEALDDDDFSINEEN